jgi:hypothetical protein
MNWLLAVRDEATVQQTFIQWLATVTERINQQMHYQFSGKPQPLVFHTPQVVQNMPIRPTKNCVYPVKYVVMFVVIPFYSTK